MAFVVEMRWEESGVKKRSVRCYYDEEWGRALDRREAGLTTGRGHYVPAPPEANVAELLARGWVKWDGLWICPTHAKELRP